MPGPGGRRHLGQIDPGAADAEHLHPVAGGDDHGFAHARRGQKPLFQGAGILDREELADLHARSAVVEPNKTDFVLHVSNVQAAGAKAQDLKLWCVGSKKLMPSMDAIVRPKTQITIQAVLRPCQPIMTR